MLGTNLTGTTAVLFGVTAATIIGSSTATSVTVTEPAGTGGAVVDVTATTADGTSVTSGADHYTYPARRWSDLGQTAARTTSPRSRS